MPNLVGMPDNPQVESYEGEALAALIRSEVERPVDAGSVVHALQGIGWAILHASTPDQGARAMREHAAETDHALTLRLIDVDVFAVHCIPNCSFHTEWRTK